jgi:carboxyl-terminal processing protease
LFIEQGPIVQIKSAGRKRNCIVIKKIEYDGPFIMVNSFSASASEILAAAIKIISAESLLVVKQTYGKGTVQM